MIIVDLPGIGELHLKHLVLDYNGTVAFDGSLLGGVEGKLNQLANDLDIYILTADTFGIARQKCGGDQGANKGVEQFKSV